MIARLDGSHDFLAVQNAAREALGKTCETCNFNSGTTPVGFRVCCLFEAQRRTSINNEDPACVFHRDAKPKETEEPPNG